VATKAEAAMAVVAIGALDARRKREVGAERQREEAATRAVEWMAAMAVTEARATRRPQATIEDVPECFSGPRAR